MKALVIEKDLSISITEVHEPIIAPFQAKCKMLACGICGSDRKILHGVPFTKPPIPYPLVLGHEGIGQVVEVGERVTKYKVGDIVTCPLNIVLPGYGGAWGAFAEYAVIFDETAAGYAGPHITNVRRAGQKQLILPDWMEVKKAPMFTVMREVLGSIKFFGIEAGESIVVCGLGPIGLAFVRFLSLKGLHPIIALDIVDEKVYMAKAFGADYSFNANDPDIAKRILDICPGGVNHVLDAVGVPSFWNEMLPALAENGQIAAFGVPAEREGMINWGSLAHWNFKLNFFQMSQAADEKWAHYQVLAAISSGAVNLDDYISDYFHFDEIVPVIGRFLNNEFLKKTIITF